MSPPSKKVKKKTAKKVKKYRSGMHPNTVKGRKATQVKPGQVLNPNGAPRAKMNLWRYICTYMEATPDELKVVLKHKNKLTMSQLAALKVCEKMAKGDWHVLKDIIDRTERSEDKPDELVKIIIEHIG